MKLKNINITGPIVIEPKVFEDDRGFFIESFKYSSFKEYGLPREFLQDNHSRSQRGVLRGLHFQAPPMDQGKLVRVSRGRVIDVYVDLRKDSPTYGKWDFVELSEKNKKIIWVPSGFAHGFLTLEDNTDFMYKVTNEYSKEHEGSISIFDPDLNIPWKEWLGYGDFTVSDKDQKSPLLKDFISPF